jgi:hypothetical protein
MGGEGSICKNRIQVFPDPALQTAMGKNLGVTVVKEDWANICEFGTNITR